MQNTIQDLSHFCHKKRSIKKTKLYNNVSRILKLGAENGHFVKKGKFWEFWSQATL